MTIAEPLAGAAPDVHRFPCPSCGSDLRYTPGADALACVHCGHEETVPASRAPIEELDLRAAAEARIPPAALEEWRMIRCESCGAEIEFEADLHARECPFCAGPLVGDTGLQRHIKPQAVLPFLVGQDEAREAMNRWLGRLWFAPSGLTQYARASRKMSGIYAPYWTYDAETRTSYAGQRGTVHYETRRVPVVVNGRRRMAAQQVAKIRWRPARGQVARDFDDVLVLGSASLPRHFTDGLAPWDLPALVPYDPRFLAGFRAEGYGIGVEEAYGDARNIMNAVIEGDVRRDIGGDRQRIGQMQTEIGRLTFKHVLLPIWMAAYRYRGRTFRFVVNGRTAAVQGERPWSASKIALAVAAMLILAGVIAWLQIVQGG